MKRKFIKGLPILTVSLLILLALLAISFASSKLYQTSVSTNNGKTWSTSFKNKRFAANKVRKLIFRLRGIKGTEYDPGAGTNFTFYPYNVKLQVDGSVVYDAGGSQDNPKTEGRWTMNIGKYANGKHDIKAMYYYDFDYGRRESYDLSSIKIVGSKAKKATTISLTATPDTIDAGGVVTLKGKLKNYIGKGLAGKKIKIKANGKIVGTTVTKKNGVFSFTHPPTEETNYQAIFSGDSKHTKVGSSEVNVFVNEDQSDG